MGATVADVIAGSRGQDGGLARLDVELLLAQVLGRNRAFLRAWPEHELTQSQLDAFAALLARRQAGEPMAYILGLREFWSLSLEVSPHTLIPRPETETLVSVALQQSALFDGERAPLRVLDLGAGSGAVALALATERPAWRIDAVDIDVRCVHQAERNAHRLGLGNVRSWRSDWFSTVDHSYAMVVANPPYVSGTDRHLQQGDVRFEPRQALVAGEGGMRSIRRIVQQARYHLAMPGIVALEHGFDQAQACQALFKRCGYSNIETALDLAGLPRVTHARWSGSVPC